jgi:hypothetical protein
VTSEDAGVWESHAEVDAVLSETGATMDKVRRWRRQGLLPKEIDWRPEAYHGSTVRYPKGTCAQQLLLSSRKGTASKATAKTPRGSNDDGQKVGKDY